MTDPSLPTDNTLSVGRVGATPSVSGWLAWLPLLLSVVVAFSFQGTRGIYDTTEGRYAVCAWEMLESGNYLEPTLLGEPHWSKPPLTYWAIAAGVRLLGRNAWGARLANAIAFVASTLLVAGIARHLWDDRTGWLAGVIYATSVFPVAAAFTISTDTLLTLFLIAAMYGYVRALRRGGLRWVVFMWVCFGFAFLTKGPPALLPLIPLLVWNHRSRDRVRLFSWVGLALFGVIGLGWYVAEVWKHPGLVDYFLGVELKERLVSDHFDRSPEWYQPFVRYLPVLLLGVLAWTPFLFGLIRREKLYVPRILWHRASDRGVGSLLLMWLAIPLAVFFVAKSRMYLYVLPLFVPIVLGVARRMTSTDFGIPSRWLVIGVVSAATLVVARGASTLASGELDMTAVYAACQAIDPQAEVCAVEENRAYGLEFCLGRALRRLSFDSEKWSDGSVRRFLKQLSSKGDQETALLVVRTKDADQLVRIVEKLAVPFVQHSIPHWLIVEVGSKE